MITEKGIHRLSILVTILFHFLILIIPLPKPAINVTQDKLSDPIPIQFIMKEIIVEKPVVPITTQSENGTHPLTETKTTPPPVTSLPGDRLSALVSKTATPYYPKDAINNNWEGTIILEVSINPDGYVSHIKIIQSTGHDILDITFMDTVREHYQFKPKRVMGENKKDTVRLNYNYEL